MRSLIETVQQVLIEGVVDSHFVKIGFGQDKAKYLAKKWAEIPSQYKSGINILGTKTLEQAEDTIYDLISVWEASKTGKEKSFKRSGVQGLKEGVDYVEIDLHSDRYQALIPLNHTASRLIASPRVGSSEGKWCVSSNTDEFWRSYQSKGSIFVFLIDFHTDDKFAHNFSKHGVHVWNKSNSTTPSIPHPEFYNKFKEAVDRVRSEIFPWNIQNVNGFIIDNARKNSDGTVSCQAITIKEECSITKLNDLPIKIKEVDQMIEVFSNTLSSLEGFPRKLRNMYVQSTALASLQGCPEEVDYMTVKAPLKTLIGAPKKARVISFYRINCDDLKGLPKSVHHLAIFESYLGSLIGSPTETHIFNLAKVKGLASLKGSPRVVRGDFMVNSNGLTTLEGCPDKIGGNFSAPFNRINSLEYLPESIGGDFILTGNTGITALGSHGEITESIKSRCKVGGKIRL